MPRTPTLTPTQIVAEVTERSAAAEVVTVDIDRHLLAILEHLVQLKTLDLLNVFMISDRQIRFLVELFEHLDKNPHMIAQEIAVIRERLAEYTQPIAPEPPDIAMAESSAPPSSQDHADIQPPKHVVAVGPRIGLSREGVDLILICLARRESEALELLKHKRINKEHVKTVTTDLKRISLHRVGQAVSGYVGLTKRALGVVEGNRLTEDRVWNRLIGLFLKANYIDEDTRNWLLDPTTEPRPKPQPPEGAPQPIDEATITLLMGLTMDDTPTHVDDINAQPALVAKLRSALNFIYLYRKSPTYFPEELKPYKESTRNACRVLHLQPRDEGSEGLWNLMLKTVFEAGIIDRKEYFVYMCRPIQLQAHRETCQLLGFVFRKESDPAPSLREACAEYWHDMPNWPTEVKFVYRILGNVRTTELGKGVRAIEDAVGTDGTRRGFLARLISEVVYAFSELRRYPGDQLLLQYPDGAASDLKSAFMKAGIDDDAYWQRMLVTLVKWGVMLQIEADPYLKEMSAE